VAIYGRVSTKGGKQDAENQLRQLRAFARSQAWSVVEEYVGRLLYTNSGKVWDPSNQELLGAYVSAKGSQPFYPANVFPTPRTDAPTSSIRSAPAL
jgi:hypothetical protein